MRVKKSVSKNGSVSYSVIKDVTVDGKRTTKIVERLGNAHQIKAKHPDMDPEDFAKKRAKELTEQEKKGKVTITSKYNKDLLIQSGIQPLKEVGPLFIEQILNQLKFDKLTHQIKASHQFQYDLNAILTMLVSTRVLFPRSKIASYEQAKTFINQPDFKIHDVYRALDVIAEHSDAIQQEVYKNSKRVINRDTTILYYDCTNFFFEIEDPEDKKQYGRSKENRPNPIIQMGLFMDGSGMPLAFTTFSGNKNEQPTLKPLEKRLVKDFELSKFVVCTDAGLSSRENRRFNNFGNRAYVTTQSIKKLKKDLKEWSLSPDGWRVSHTNTPVNLEEIDLSKHRDTIFYKERWIVNEASSSEKKDGYGTLQEKLIVSFSPKYQAYQAGIREKQIQRAVKAIDSPSRMEKKSPNDPLRFVKSVSVTDNGEIAGNKQYTIDEKIIKQEAQYDGFYAVCTNLEASAEEIVKINKRRWQIEESFRIMKSDFKSRPVYLRNESRIDAHFLVCFLALLCFRILENKLDEKYTCSEIITTLRNMKWLELKGEGHVPAYERTDLTDRLHEIAGFRTDYELIDTRSQKNILKIVKNGNSTQ